MNAIGFKLGSNLTQKSTSVIRTTDYSVFFDHKKRGFDNYDSENTLIIY